MSFLIKNSEYRFLVSISSLDEDEVIVLATDLNKYYVEKAVSYALIDDRLNELNSIRFPVKKVMKNLMESFPSPTSIELVNDHLQIELEFSIKINEQKHEKLKLNFDLIEITSIAEVSQYFVSGFIRSLVELTTPTNKIVLSHPAFQFTEEILKMHKDLSVMINGKAEKTQSTQEYVTKKPSMQQRRIGKKTQVNRFIPKPKQIEQKKLEFYDNMSSQDLTDDPQPSTSSESTSITPTVSQEEPPKKKIRKKLSIKF